MCHGCRPAGLVMTLEVAHLSEAASKLLKLISLSEGIPTDAAFARQARRKLAPS
eukprot:COSAG06_NODE_344_length_17074_cov_116.626510_17_plen_54_part_00